MNRNYLYLPAIFAAASIAACATGVSDKTPGAAPDAAAADDASTTHPLPALPLATSGRWILDRHGERFKLASVNWYGAEQKDYVVAGLELEDRRAIAARIRELGFNSVRLPWSNEMVELDPVVRDAVLAANPDLRGKTALQVFDAVIEALADEGLVVILANHVSNADWCCSDRDGNGLWYTDDYPESSWLGHWQELAQRYRDQPAVVGADLRNELRPVLEPTCTACDRCPCAECECSTPTWGGDDPTVDWAAAAERGGNAILGINPTWLIVVQGVNYSGDLGGPYTRPLQLDVDNRLVYSPHEYRWFHQDFATYEELKTELGNRWGYLLVQDKPYTAPLWISEFGTCTNSVDCLIGPDPQGAWFVHFAAYLTEADMDWAYWALNGTQARATGRTFGAPDEYGVLDPSWTLPASETLLDHLQALQPATQGP